MNIIYISVYAGLGNQLFMIFAGMSYAIDNGFNYMFYSLNRPVCITDRGHFWNNLFERIKDKVLPEYDDSFPQYEDKYFHYVKIPSLNYDFNLRGYFQSYKYFEHNYEQIMETLKLYDKINDVKNKYNHYFKKKTIGIHFRIGDVIKADYCRPGLDLLLKPSYYHNALSYLETIFDINDYDILYFAENLNHDKIMINVYIENINKNRNYNFIKVSDDIPTHEQLLLMSLCDNLIIANSTFSWFGAYLNINKNKKIIYPSKWLGNDTEYNNMNDLFPKDWIEISRT